MEEINIGLISRLSKGLLSNIAIFEKALDAANEAGIDTSEYILSRDTVLAMFFRSDGNIEKMKELAPDPHKWSGSIFDAEADRISQEMSAQAALLRKLLGFKEPILDADSPEKRLIKLRNLALAGLAVSKEE